MLNVIKKTHSAAVFLRKYGFAGAAILNAGSSTVRFGPRSVNVDIQNKRGIDCRADIHELPFASGTFDLAIVTAVLQYCAYPREVVREIARVLKPQGLVYVDAPFVQPYCPDTPDLFRFTRDGLIELFKDCFLIEECDTAIPGGSAAAFYMQQITETRMSSANRYLRYAATLLTSLLVYPFSLINFNRNTHVAGALYLVGRKRKR